MQSENLAPLAKALSAAQGELNDATKSSINPGFKSKYADLAEILQTIRPVAFKHGLSFVQKVGYTDGLASVETVMMHSEGGSISSILHVPVTKKDAQGLGSALTYGRRYSIAAMFGISQDDDDGNTAVGKEPKVKQYRQSQVPEDVERVQWQVKFANAGSAKELEDIAKDFAKLPADLQGELMPAAKAARVRIQAA